MRSTTLRTIPGSYCKTCDTFWASDATAFGTGLRSPSLVNIDIDGLPSGSLVPQHMPEHRPARVMDGFSHLGLGEAGRAHVSDSDQSVLPRQFRTGDVKVVTSRTSDLGVDGADALFVPGALGTGERIFVSSVMLQSRDCRPVAHGGELFEAEVNPDRAFAGDQIVSDFALESDVPEATRILDESALLACACNLAVLPEAEVFAVVGYGVPNDSDSSCLEGYPAECTFGPETGAEARGFSYLVPRCSEAPTNGRDCLGGNAKLVGCASTEINEVKGGWPSGISAHLAATFSFSLCRDTEIPDLISLDGVVVKTLPAGLVFDPKFVGENAHQLFERGISVGQTRTQ